MRNIVITIARQYGSGGKTIGAMLAHELGINCYSREILRMASEDSGINERLFGMSDEKVRHAPWFRLLSRPYDGELLTPENKEFTSDDNLFNYQAKIIKDLAAKESCVIVGRCADYALADFPNVVNVYLYADLQSRIARIARRHDVTDAKAKDLIQKTDKSRASYYNYYTNKKWGEATGYDLCLNTASLGIDGTIHMIREFAAYKEREHERI